MFDFIVSNFAWIVTNGGNLIVATVIIGIAIYVYKFFVK